MDQQSVSPIAILLQQRDVLPLICESLNPKDLLSFSMTCKPIYAILDNIVNIQYLLYKEYCDDQYKKLLSFECKDLERKKRNGSVKFEYYVSINTVFLGINEFTVKNQNVSTITIKIPKYLSAKSAVSCSIYCVDNRKHVGVALCKSMIEGNKLTITRMDGDALSFITLVPNVFSLCYTSKYSP